MDTSETYIKMCEKTKEIQKESVYHQGYYDYWSCSICHLPDKEHTAYPTGLCKFWKGVWLPRQDQLQEMLKDKFRLTTGEIFLIKPFYDFHLSQTTSNVNGSMEQLWLAFVMKERFQKIWNGKDWVRL